MEIYETDKITVQLGYDVEHNKSMGKVRKKEENGKDTLVGLVCDGELLIKESCAEPEMIKAEYQKLKEMVAGYEETWRGRVEHERTL